MRRQGLPIRQMPSCPLKELEDVLGAEILAAREPHQAKPEV